MKLTRVLILAIGLLLTKQLPALAQDNAPPRLQSGGSTTSAAEQSEEHWWHLADEADRPDFDAYRGIWLLEMKLFDDAGREINENQLMTLSNYPAQVSNKRAAGQQGSENYSELTDYSLLLWVIPDALTTAFRENGYLDWPVPNSDVRVVGEEGSWIESSPPTLTDEQKRDLFEQALGEVLEITVDGLHLYIYSRNASRAEINLRWQVREDMATDTPGEDENRVRPVADLTVYFDSSPVLQADGGTEE